ncbi:hypothetical protein LCGC14_1507300 [marine sediment metagenome]|uniref:Uncharacterized protein n=1 Tax=marine sediment metagenome TaxID=412755 RepID=A0A0F9LHU4_9ZZZZ
MGDEKPSCFGSERLAIRCIDCKFDVECEQKSKEGKMSNKPECFGEHSPECDDCEVCKACEFYSKEQDEPIDTTREFVKCLQTVQTSETVAERMALKIFEESIKHPLLLLADNIKAVYASRGDPIAIASALAHSITKEIIDDLLGGD